MFILRRGSGGFDRSVPNLTRGGDRPRTGSDLFRLGGGDLLLFFLVVMPALDLDFVGDLLLDFVGELLPFLLGDVERPSRPRDFLPLFSLFFILFVSI